MGSLEERCKWLRDGYNSPGQRSDIAQYVGEKKLNLGCGPSPEPVWAGWDNADINTRSAATLLFDMRDACWPIVDETYDTVLAYNVMHLFQGEGLFHVMWEVWRILKPGGFFIGTVPFGWTGNPLHLQCWTEATPSLLNKTAYFTSETSMTCCDQMIPMREWDIAEVVLFPNEQGAPVSMRFVMRRPLG